MVGRAGLGGTLIWLLLGSGLAVRVVLAGKPHCFPTFRVEVCQLQQGFKLGAGFGGAVHVGRESGLFKKDFLTFI
jgi:hypothetical protein